MTVNRRLWQGWPGVLVAMALGLCMAIVVLFDGLGRSSYVSAEGSAEGLSMVVEKRANAAWAFPGEVVTYSVRLTDTLAPAGTVWLTDTLQEELEYVADSLTATRGTFGVAGGVVTWTDSMAGDGDFAVISFTAVISSDASVSVDNSAVVVGGGEMLTDTVRITVLDERALLPTAFRGYWLPYHDDFSNPSSGWAIRRGDDNLIEPYDFRTKYQDGYLYTLLVGRYDFQVTSPLATASPPYTITTRVKIVDDTIDGIYYWPKHGETYGIVFGANSGGTCPADRYTPLGQGCLSHYYRLLVVWRADVSDYLEWSLKRIDYHDPNNGGKQILPEDDPAWFDSTRDGEKGDGLMLINWDGDPVSDANGWNEWTIKVSETSPNISIYLNGALVGTADDTRYLYDPVFGMFMASTQYGGVAYMWDWFDVSP